MSDLLSSADNVGFREAMRAGLRLMTARERKVALWLVVSIIVNGLLQTVALIGVVPVVQAMIDPTAALAGRFLAWLRPLIGEGADQSVLLRLAGGLAVIILIRTFYGWAHIRWLTRFTEGCERRMATMVMAQVVGAPYEWMLLQNSEHVREVLFGHSIQWSRDFIRTLIQIGNDLVFAAFLLTALILASPATGILVAVVVLGMAISIFAAVRPTLLRLAQAKRNALIRAHITSTETIRGIKDVKMAGAEDRHTKMFSDQIAIYSGSDASTQQWRQLTRLGLELLAYGTLIGISVGVVLSGARGSEISGLLVLYALAAVRLLPMVNMIVTSLGTLAGSAPLVVELERLIADTATAEGTQAQAGDIGKWQRIDLNAVSYSYRNSENPALAAVNLSIDRGKSYGIVGPSGAGKSTLIDVVAGLLEPTSGAVLIDGRPLDASRRLAWRHKFGYVAQRPFLLDASLRENILFDWEHKVDEARLAKAVSLARLNGVVSRLPGGLDGRVGEQGASLSGGEQQRVAIARALYRGAEILILDEATSSLDSLVEREIAESILELHGRITTLVVSHRLGLVRGCDEIWIVDESRMIASGSHPELLKSSDLYRRMVAAQEGSAMPSGAHAAAAKISHPATV